MQIEKYVKITDRTVKSFAKLTGDYNPIHIDDAFASTSIFKNRIAHGMLVASQFSTMIANDYPGPGSIYLSQTIQFIKPCYIGDTIRYQIELVNQEKSKFFLKTIAFNSSNDMIIVGDAIVINNNLIHNNI
jgi:3-hydroxybutyryl-CoA dehydratase